MHRVLVNPRPPHLVSVNLSCFVSPSQSLPLWFAQHLELICSLLTCLDSRDSLFQPFVLCIETSTRSACCSVVSGGYLNTLTFVGLVLVNSCFIHPSFWVFDLFLIPLNSLSVLLLLLSSVLKVPNLRTPSQKRTVYRTYIYI